MSQRLHVHANTRSQQRSSFGTVLGLLLLFSFAGLGCRLEFGLTQAGLQNSQAAPMALESVNQTQITQPTAQMQLPAVTQASPTPLPISTLPPSPTVAATASSTPTPPTRLEPTVTARKTIAYNPPVEPGPSPTPISLIPARYPPGKLIAPAINLDAPVQPAGWLVAQQNGESVSVWDIPDDAAGWHQNSALPGHGSNVVLSGHHNLGTEVFRELVNLTVGDEIVLQADTFEYHYQVTDRFIVPERNASPEQRQQNAQWILPTVDERMTLITCWPYQSNSHRLIVVAKPVSFTEL